MAEELFQVRNLYTDQRFDGFLLKAGKKAVVRVGLEKIASGYRGQARIDGAGTRVVAEAEGATPDAALDAVIQRLYDTHFNFVARIDAK
jgi:ribosome-associated translation inhibitor RaiA